MRSGAVQLWYPFLRGFVLQNDVHIHTFTQFYTVARASDKVTQEVTAYLKNGVFSYFGTSLATADESRPIRLTETLRNRIKADIAADQRSIPIFLVEKSKNTSGGFGDVLITRKPVESPAQNKP